MCCLTASMFPFPAALWIETSGALAVVGYGFIPRAGSAPLFAVTALGGVVGFVALATGSSGFVSGAGVNCCDSPHPTTSTAATIAISCDFMVSRLSSRWAQFSTRFNCSRKMPSALQNKGWWLNRKHTSRSARRAIGATSKLYSEADCSYFVLVLIPRNEVWSIPFSEIRGKSSACTNIEHDSLSEYRGNIDGLKKCQQ